MAFNFVTEPLADEAKRALAPSGTLRAGINLSNSLLVSGKTPDGSPAGVSPDLARAIAESLNLPVKLVTYQSPGLLADAASKDEWDIALIGAEPQRAETIRFTPAYSQIEASFLVQPNSAIKTIGEVDKIGTRVAVKDRTAYCLWLERNIKYAALVLFDGFESSFSSFLDDKLDALAGLRPKLLEDQKLVPGSKILEGRFTAVQQAVGVPKAKAAAIGHLSKLIDLARTNGFVADLIRKYGVQGLSVPEA
ncbi:transporter substrate-binding domain-containing protein [Terrarubrum flagellatum]|uniref:transporter substrate-binding domain-containing protein n=1 Tax=Terrirubrum flagellatum TaxID=2895980 RepID=UPI003144F024